MASTYYDYSSRHKIMKIFDTTIADVKIIEPMVFGDQRGFFYESYNQDQFDAAIGSKVNFIQDNHSKSCLGVLRGLHYQIPPHAQAKLVRCINGCILDVVVDIRKSSPTFGKHFSIELNETNKLMLWIPRGFAHGFITLSDSAEFVYKTDNLYNKTSERCIRWDDPDLKIPWPITTPQLSQKDSKATYFRDADKFD